MKRVQLYFWLYAQSGKHFSRSIMVSQKCFSSRYFQNMYLFLLILFTIKYYIRINTFRERNYVDSKISIFLTKGKVVIAISQKVGSVWPDVFRG